MGRASFTRIGCWLQKVSAQILTVGLSSSFLRSHPPGPPDEGGPSNLHVLIFGGKEDYWQNRPGCLVSHGGRVLQVGADYLLLSEEAARRHLCRNSAPSRENEAIPLTECPFPHSYTASRDAAKDSLLLAFLKAQQSPRRRPHRNFPTKTNDFGSQQSSMRGGRAFLLTSYRGRMTNPLSLAPLLGVAVLGQKPKSAPTHTRSPGRQASKERHDFEPPLRGGSQKNWISLSKLAPSTHQPAGRGLRSIGLPLSLALPCCRALLAR